MCCPTVTTLDTTKSQPLSTKSVGRGRKPDPTPTNLLSILNLAEPPGLNSMQVISASLCDVPSGQACFVVETKFFCKHGHISEDVTSCHAIPSSLCQRVGPILVYFYGPELTQDPSNTKCMAFHFRLSLVRSHLLHPILSRHFPLPTSWSWEQSQAHLQLPGSTHIYNVPVSQLRCPFLSFVSHHVTHYLSNQETWNLIMVPFLCPCMPKCFKMPRPRAQTRK